MTPSASLTYIHLKKKKKRKKNRGKEVETSVGTFSSKGVQNRETVGKTEKETHIPEYTNLPWVDLLSIVRGIEV